MVDKAQKALEEAEALKKLFARQELVLDFSKYIAADVCIVRKQERLSSLASEGDAALGICHPRLIQGKLPSNA
ncbi:hypothetical protein SLA2020_067270 [Shorea laevis]